MRILIFWFRYCKRYGVGFFEVGIVLQARILHRPSALMANCSGKKRMNLYNCETNSLRNCVFIWMFLKIGVPPNHPF